MLPHAHTHSHRHMLMSLNQTCIVAPSITHNHFFFYTHPNLTRMDVAKANRGFVDDPT